MSAETTVTQRSQTSPSAAAPLDSSWRLGVLIVAVTVSLIDLYYHLPAAGGYHVAADEGAYYRHARSVSLHGWGGLRLTAEEYIGDRGLHIYPPPTRLLSTLTNALALGVDDSYRSLAVLSLVWFVVLIFLARHYVSRLWDERVGLIASLFLTFSPLFMAMAKRALIDSLSSLLSAWVLFSFLDYARHHRRRSLVSFCIAVAFSLLNRETAILFCPFYAGSLLLLTPRERLATECKTIAVATMSIAAAVSVVMVAAFGIHNLVGIGAALYRSQILMHHSYAVVYCNGPWYRYLVDLMLLSPMTLILATLAAGRTLLDRQRDLRIDLLLAFFAYVLVVFVFTYKNIRYATVLDIEVRLLAAIGVVQLVNTWTATQIARRRALCLVVLMLVAFDLRSFHRYFVTDDIYDPVSASLLAAERFIP
ncbi:MAG TPA: glycosyltransferase family 39 protein [Thermoanaerobaculia bacterium]|nr:glycosyltransferase family 39 protein [Thermoanaerobaculia bacterium]